MEGSYPSVENRSIGAARRVLVKEPNWLGDVVMSLPALRAVRRGFPESRLAVLVRRELAGFFEGLEGVDEVVPYGVKPGVAGLLDRLRVVSLVRAGRFDLAVLFPKSFESAFWMAAARVPRRVGVVGDARRLFLTDRVRPDPEGNSRHQVHSYLRMLHEALGIEGSADDFALRAPEPGRERMRRWLTARRKRAEGRWIALAPAAAYGRAKEWPAERYAALVDRLNDDHGIESVLVGTPAERERCEQIGAASRAGAVVAAGKTGVGDLVALLSLASGFAGNDSGAMHVAGALGIPTVGLFGSTRPDRTGPLGAKTKVLYHRIECSPCLDRTCRFGHYECLKRIAVEEVIVSLGELGALR